MVLNHRKKSSRHRGSWTHGHGEKKKRRGAGSRGGRGNAGSGKSGDAKKPRYWKIKNFSGKHGFTNPTKKDVKTMSLAQLNGLIDQLVTSGNAVVSNSVFKINCKDLGVKKLLGTGTPTRTYEIVVDAATKGAIQKVEALKGKVLLSSNENLEKQSKE